MIEVTQGREKGQWWPVVAVGFPGLHANYFCSVCGKPNLIPADTILSDGSIDPKVVHSTPILASNPPLPELANVDLRNPTIKCSGCDTHNSIRLIGWKSYKK